MLTDTPCQAPCSDLPAISEESLTIGSDARTLARATSSSRRPVAPFKILGRICHAMESCSAGCAHVAAMASSIKYHRHLIDNRVEALEVVAPNARQGYVVLHLHGGGYATGSVWFYTPFLQRLSETTRARVISINYRKSPEHSYPAALDDTLATWRWLQARGYSPKSIAVVGDSAGGNLGFALSVRLAQLGEAQPAACMGLSPWLLLDPNLADSNSNGADGILAVPPEPRATVSEKSRVGKSYSMVLPAVRALQASSLWDKGAVFFMGQYFQGEDPANPLISPLLVSNELLRLFPPILLHVDKDEPLAVQAKEMAVRSQGLDIPTELHMYEGTMHGMQIYNMSCKVEAEDSLNRIYAFLEKVWEPSASAP